MLGADEKELLYYWNALSLEVLVPKRRGKGFLRVPYGHHRNDHLADIEYAIGCDISGLDGTLSISAGGKVAAYTNKRADFVALVMPMLGKHYGFPFRAATAEDRARAGT